MRGHARVRISGSDASTNVTIYSVGSVNVVDQSIIKPGEVYDGVADLAELEIVSNAETPSGSVFGGIRAGNASFWAHAGRVGIYAPRVHVQNVVRIAEVQAFDEASPALVFGQNSQFVELEVADGGTLVQPNERLIAVDYQFSLRRLPPPDGTGISYPFVEDSPGTPGTYGYRYFLGPDGARLLWVVAPPASS